MLLSKGMPVLQVRLGHALLTVATVGLLCWAIRLHQQYLALAIDVQDTNPTGDSLPEEEYLERLTGRYVLGNLTEWQAWRVQTSRVQSLAAGSVTDVHADFQPDRDAPKVIHVDNPSPTDLRASKGLELAVHADQRQDGPYASIFIFGISTSYSRIVEKDRAILRAWKRWLTKSDGTTNGASLVLMLDNATEEQLNEIDKALEEAGIDVYASSTAEPTSKIRRYHELIRVMKSYGATIAASGQEKHWFAVVEDTVFFPSLSHLHQRLSTYDVSKQLYVSIPGEETDGQKDGRSVTKYGAGAIFLTKHAVSLIPKLSCMELDEAPKQPFHGQRWDAELKKCLEKQTSIDMHVIPALHAPNEASYEPPLEGHGIGVRPLLLNDYEYRHRLDVGMAHLVTDACGDACFMHQYLFHDNWVIINGVSISHHPDGLSHHRHSRNAAGKGHLFKDAQRSRVSSQTSAHQDEAERRPVTWTGRRDVWRLLDSTKASDETIWQAYIKRGGKPAKEDGGKPDGLKELDSIIVLIWEKRQH
ncbi:uncharacterized protein MAM_03816 [Metarhizium album ARSEF 1941]|uniref:Glycosyltransferase family 31 protein n=1 Tax=Metarhizium album (strain ARSEF 1941) TaxID=1081103 RepID=A0A0B2WYW7_METAS|nr:uncharacterized protein MAM_03816 [Metarhizium album ARSEF 1941]KHN98055.1 hypothetical protein MAM_03816 [Metarhizium album ARSEF 1941]